MKQLPLIELETATATRVVEFGRDDRTIERGSRQWRMLVVGCAMLAVAVVALLPFFLPVIEGRLVSRVVGIGVALVGLQFCVGRAGQLSLCHGVFVGLGSYAMTLSVARMGWPHLVGLLVAPVVGFVAGSFVGVLAVRIKATYLGPVTISVAVAFPMIVKRFSWFTGGSSGLGIVGELNAPQWFASVVGRPHLWNHVIIVAVGTVAVILASNVTRSPVGLAVRAMADAPLAAAASGVNLWRMRVVAYGWSAAFGALGGALLVIDTPIVGADSYDVFRSLGYFAAMMVGGVSSMIGAAIGAIILVAVPWLTDTFSLTTGPNVVLGALLVLSTLLAPHGLAVGVLALVRRRVRVTESAD